MNQGQRDEMMIEMHSNTKVLMDRSATQAEQIETIHKKIDENAKLPIKNASSIKVMWIIGGGLFTVATIIIAAIVAS